MMSAPSASTEKSLGGYDSDNLSTTQSGIPLPYFCGTARLPAVWISEVYKVRENYSGKTRPKDVYANIIAAYACVPAERTTRLFKNGHDNSAFTAWGLSFDGQWTDPNDPSPVWLDAGHYNDGEAPLRTGAISSWSPPARSPQTLYRFFDRGVDHQGDADGRGDLGDMTRLHWGLPDSQTSDRLLTGAEIGGEDHPPYRCCLYEEFRQLHLGAGSGELPNVERVFQRGPNMLPAEFSGLVTDYDDAGVCPVAALVEFMCLDIGLGMSPEEFHIASLEELSASYAADSFRVSPVLTEFMSAEAFVNKMITLMDAYPVYIDGKLSFERVPVSRVTHSPGAICQLSNHDLINGTEGLKTVTLREVPNEFNITCRAQAGWLMRDNTLPLQAPRARKVAGKAITENITEKWIAAEWVHRRWAAMRKRVLSQPRIEGTLTVRRHALVWPTHQDVPVEQQGTRLRPGDILELVDVDLGLERTPVLRILEIRFEYGSDEIEIDVETDRGSHDLESVAEDPALPDLTLPDVDVLGETAVIEVPWRVAKTPRPSVAFFVERPTKETAAVYAHYSPDGSSYTEVARVDAFATRARLNVELLEADSVCELEVLSDGLGYFDSQSAIAQADDVLLAFIGQEILSLGTILAQGGGTYSVEVLRGRIGSLAADHSANAELWILPREYLQLYSRADWTAGSNTYWKFQPANIFQRMQLSDPSILALSLALLPATYDQPQVAIAMPVDADQNDVADVTPYVGQPFDLEATITDGASNLTGTSILVTEYANGQASPATRAAQILSEPGLPLLSERLLKGSFTPVRSGWHLVEFGGQDERQGAEGSTNFESLWVDVLEIPALINPVIEVEGQTYIVKWEFASGSPIYDVEVWMSSWNTSDPGANATLLGTVRGTEFRYRHPVPGVPRYFHVRPVYGANESGPFTSHGSGIYSGWDPAATEQLTVMNQVVPSGAAWSGDPLMFTTTVDDDLLGQIEIWGEVTNSTGADVDWNIASYEVDAGGSATVIGTGVTTVPANSTVSLEGLSVRQGFSTVDGRCGFRFAINSASVWGLTFTLDRIIIRGQVIKE